jgi:hypothetical protein
MKMLRKATRPAHPAAEAMAVKPLDNTAVRIPAAVRRSIRSRQAQSRDDEKAVWELDRARSLTSEECAARETLIERLAEKLGIYPELVALADLEGKRASRWKRALKEARAKVRRTP